MKLQKMEKHYEETWNMLWNTKHLKNSVWKAESKTANDSYLHFPTANTDITTTMQMSMKQTVCLLFRELQPPRILKEHNGCVKIPHGIIAWTYYNQLHFLQPPHDNTIFEMAHNVHSDGLTSDYASYCMLICIHAMQHKDTGSGMRFRYINRKPIPMFMSIIYS